MPFGPPSTVMSTSQQELSQRPIGNQDLGLWIIRIGTLGKRIGLKQVAKALALENQPSAKEH